MSRSFHTTKRDVKDAEKFTFSDDAYKRNMVDKHKGNLQKKRNTKRAILDQRKNRNTILLPTDIDSIPIEICDHSDYLHYPVSEEDIRSVLKMMPAGMLDGLSKIKLCLGAKVQYENEEDDFFEDTTCDPYLGRSGYEIIPGVYCSDVLGQYISDKAEIMLFGFVYSPDLQDRSMWELYMKLRMLLVLAHEVGHHYDFTFRMSRGRWRWDHRSKLEIYAENVENELKSKVVIPYLMANYKHDIENLNRWIKEHSGIAISLGLLAGDSRVTSKKGCINERALFNTSESCLDFITHVLGGKGLVEARLDFSESLHWAQEYDLAMEIIEQVLLKEPENVRAMCMKADVFSHLEKYDLAIKYANDVLTIDPNNIDALFEIFYAYRDMEEWERVIEMSHRILSVLSGKKGRCWSALYWGGYAFLELGRYQEVQKNIEELEKIDKKTSQLDAKKLRERLEEKLQSDCQEIR